MAERGSGTARLFGEIFSDLAVSELAEFSSMRIRFVASTLRIDRSLL